MLGKEGKLTTTSRVCSRICQTPSRSVESWKAWKDQISDQGIFYQYVLSVMNVFSRLVCLRPVESRKNNKAVASE